MPNMDGTGRIGLGPETSRGCGPCDTGNQVKFVKSASTKPSILERQPDDGDIFVRRDTQQKPVSNAEIRELLSEFLNT